MHADSGCLGNGERVHLVCCMSCAAFTHVHTPILYERSSRCSLSSLLAAQTIASNAEVFNGRGSSLANEAGLLRDWLLASYDDVWHAGLQSFLGAADRSASAAALHASGGLRGSKSSGLRVRLSLPAGMRVARGVMSSGEAGHSRQSTVAASTAALQHGNVAGRVRLRSRSSQQAQRQGQASEAGRYSLRQRNRHVMFEDASEGVEEEEGEEEEDEQDDGADQGGDSGEEMYRGGYSSHHRRRIPGGTNPGEGGEGRQSNRVTIRLRTSRSTGAMAS